MTGITEDLFSERFDLFIPVPNARATATQADAVAAAAAAASAGSSGAAGDASDTGKYVPNPKYGRSAGLAQRAMPMYTFVGQLMGLSLRTRIMLPFEFPSLVWKALCGQPAGIEDLDAVDAVAAATIRKLATWPKEMATDAAAFAAAFLSLRFTATAADGEIVPLVPGGADVAVTLANRQTYVTLLTQFHFAQYEQGLAAMRSGLWSVVPAHALRLLSWQELDIAVAGKPEIDIEVMKAHTGASSAAIQWACASAFVSHASAWQSPTHFPLSHRPAAACRLPRLQRQPADGGGLLEGNGEPHAARARAVYAVFVRPLAPAADELAGPPAHRAAPRRLGAVAATGAHVLLLRRHASVPDGGADAVGHPHQHLLQRRYPQQLSAGTAGRLVMCLRRVAAVCTA